MDNPFNRLTKLRDYAPRAFILNDDDDYAMYNTHTNEFDIIMNYGDLLPPKERLPTPIPRKFRPIIALLMKSSTPFVLEGHCITFYSRFRIWVYQYMEYCNSNRRYIPTTPSLTHYSPVTKKHRDLFNDDLLRVKLGRESVVVMQQNRVALYQFASLCGRGLTLNTVKYIQMPSNYEVIDAVINGYHGVVLIRNVQTRMTYHNVCNEYSPPTDTWVEHPPDYSQIPHNSSLAGGAVVKIPTIGE